MNRKINILKEIDWIIILLYFVLCVVGWFNIYSANADETIKPIVDLSLEHGKQLFFIFTSLAIGIIILFTSSKMYVYYSFYFYIIAMFLLLLVVFVGKEIGGARSWFHIGGFSIQPSEFAKFSTLLLLGVFISNKQTDLLKFKDQLIAFAIIALPVLLILLQPDAGSALVYISLIFVLYREGISSWYLWAGLGAIFLFIITLLIPLGYVALIVSVLLGISFFISNKKTRKKQLPKYLLIGVASILFSLQVGYVYKHIFKPHQRNRIDIILGKIQDTSGVGWNLEQSKIAIGSGGFSGKGFLQGTQTKFDFVPEQSTDFIFCTIGEEWGAIGSVVVISLFLALILRIIIVSEKQRSTFTRVYGYGVASILFIHFFINIGMTIGLVPVIGIPLPFLSYGGSSLWGFSILLFIFIKLASERKEIL